MKKAISILLLLALALSLFACGKETVDPDSLWSGATYTEDTEVGSGSKTLTVEVTMEEKTITLTVHTDAATVGEALLAEGIIDGEMGDYGLYMTEVLGVTADYNVDQSYWAFYVDGGYAMTGVDATDIDENAVYGLTYTKD